MYALAANELLVTFRGGEERSGDERRHYKCIPKGWVEAMDGLGVDAVDDITAGDKVKVFSTRLKDWVNAKVPELQEVYLTACRS